MTENVHTYSSVILLRDNTTYIHGRRLQAGTQGCVLAVDGEETVLVEVRVRNSPLVGDYVTDLVITSRADVVLRDQIGKVNELRDAP